MDAEKEPQDDKVTAEFPIVGIGASAGGLKAAGTFLENCAADSGMAFVLVFHLDPKHKSEAAALLQRHTRMPVAQVEGHTKVLPDHVYVIPPSHGLVLADDVLTLTKLERAEGRPTVIDHFFRSLAEHAREHAIGIILSGTGSEGSQGLKAIKEAGGLTVVQEEGEAEYDGMPHSAIATGLIDFVLPVAAIPAKLLEVKDYAFDFAVPEQDSVEADSDAELLQKIFVQLRTRVGHDFSQYKQNTILRRIARRMQVHRLQNLGAYLEAMRSTPAEADALLRELLISVTNFFRDPDAMAALARELMPKLCKRMEGQTVRVWVPGCATGEEAYSLAILLSEACDGLAKPPRLQIFATDVDERALETARRGWYPDAIAGDVSELRLERFFDHQGEGFAVKGYLREMILFTRHDLLQDPPFSRLDLISCRNLLIYLKSEIQARVFALFHFALREEGCLFLGSSESLGGSSRLFGEIDRKAKIFQSRRVPVSEVPFPVLPDAPRQRTQRREAGGARAGFGEIAREELLTRYAPPCVIVGENYDVTYISGRIGRYLEPGSGEVNYNILDMARNGLRMELRTLLYKAFHGGEGVRRKIVRVHGDGRDQRVALTVRPLAEADGHVLVVFEELDDTETAAPEPSRSEDGDGMLAQLEAELTNTRESLQTSIEELETSNEELRASNEELQSVNEELQSTTEELETGKEELQSTNEELIAVNHELQARNDELARTNADLNNLLSSTEIGTLFLDGDLRIRRYAPRTTDIFNLIASDVGRPFAHLTHHLQTDDLVADARRVLHDVVTVERELASKDGRFYEARLRPYRTIDNKVDGVVLTFVDVTERHLHEQQTQELNRQLEIQKAYSDSIVATVREPMLVLDADLRVVTASRSFYRDFEATPARTDHKLLYEMDGNRWDVPELRRALEEILPQRTTVDGFEVRLDFGHGERALLLNARGLQQAEGAEPLILLAFEDATERMRGECWLQEQAGLLEGIASKSSLDEALTALCAAMERLNSKVMAAVPLANEERSAMARVLTTQIPASFGQELAGAPINDLFIGTCGTAIHEDRQVTCADIQRDERWSKEWRDLCEAHGVRACHSTPVHDVDGTPRASLLLCFDHPHAIEPWERRLGEFGAHVASIAIQRERAARELRESEQKYRTLFDTMDDGFCIIEMIFDEAGKPVDYRYLETNPAFARHATRPMQGKRIKEIVPDFEQHWLDHYGSVARAGGVLQLEGVVHGLGDQWFQTSAVRFGGEDSNLVAVMFTNITRRKQADREAVQLAAIVDSSDDAIISKDLDGVISTWNASAEQMFGYTAAEAIGRPITSLIIPADRMDEEDDILRRIAQGDTIDHFETVRHRKDGVLLDVSVTISPLVEAGHIIGASKIARDIRERKQAERHRDLLIHELNHRVKNTLATVQALALQTFRGPSLERALETFEARLLALSAAHDVLTRENWRGAGLQEIVRNALAPWRGGGRSRVSIEGPDLRLRPAAALALSMALHELATNAAKYGALSNKQGKVAIHWTVSGNSRPCFRLRWLERGGPSVQPPAKRGFGSRLIEYGLAQDLGGTVKLTFAEGGVECAIEAPVDEIQKPGGHDE